MPNKVDSIVDASRTTERIVEGTRSSTTLSEQGMQGPAGPPGPEGPQGPPGESGAVGGAHRHVQSAAALVWTINHNLGYFPNISTFNASGDEFKGKLQHLDNMTATVTNSAAQSGVANAS